jgi:hypothetical protein
MENTHVHKRQRIHNFDLSEKNSAQERPKSVCEHLENVIDSR